MSSVPRLLAVNAGSSSIKFSVFESDGSLRRVLAGSIDRIGLAGSTLRVTGNAPSNSLSKEIAVPGQAAATNVLLDWVGRHNDSHPLLAVGHRIVQGGPAYDTPQRITPLMLEALRQFAPADPEHLPAEIGLIEAIRERFPALTQIACFDTGFHRDLPRLAQLLSIPRSYQSKGLKRYGFHGLSYSYVMRELARVAGDEAAKGQIILAHLGNGASMAAVGKGRALDTTMGFTPASGLVMGTRTGDIDPGIVSYLAKTGNLSASAFDHMVHHESGLLGVSELSSDMRDLLAQENVDVRAKEAIDLFCYSAKKSIGAYSAVLSGLDTLIFTGGIGENAAVVRKRICEGLDFLGIELDEKRNLAHADVISTDESDVTVRIICTNEELMIAISLCEILGLPLDSSGTRP